MKSYVNSNYNKGKKDYHYTKSSCCHGKPSCNNNCPDEHDGYDCHEKTCQNPGREQNTFPSDCCTSSIKDALEVIKDSIRSMGKSSLILDVNLYTIGGDEYTVSFSKSNLCNIEITNDAIVFNCQAISLNSIVRIEVLTSDVSSQFKNEILRKLNCLTSACENPYLAYDLDEESVCPRCRKSKCNCRRSNTFGDYINDNVNDLQTASYLGNTDSTFAIDEITPVDVVSEVTLSVNPATVLEDVTLRTDTDDVVVGNCLGNGRLRVSADDIPVSMDDYNANLVNQLNHMVRCLNDILKKCCCKQPKCGCCCEEYDNCSNCHDYEYDNCYEDDCFRGCNKNNKYKDNDCHCRLLPLFDEDDFLRTLRFDLNESVTINGSPVDSRCVTISAINSASLEKTPVDVVGDVSVNTESIPVVESITGESVDILTPASPQDLDVASATAGNGLLVVDENSGNISIYSVCNLDSVETDCE